MARGVNKVILIGRVGKDPDCTYAQGGKAVAKMSLATSEEWEDKATGEKKEQTEWHRIVVFGRLAEVCGNYLKKGSQVYIEGRLQTRKWEKDGQTHYSTEIKAQRVQFLDRKDGGNNQSQPQPQQRSEDDDIPPAFPSEAQDMDSIPF